MMARAPNPDELEALLQLGLALRTLGPSLLDNYDHTWVLTMGPKSDAPNEPIMMWTVNGEAFEVDGTTFTDEMGERIHQVKLDKIAANMAKLTKK